MPGGTLEAEKQYLGSSVDPERVSAGLGLLTGHFPRLCGRPVVGSDWSSRNCGAELSLGTCSVFLGGEQ